eukprot:1138748-Pelagomonas_calceolata.AAC.2
MSLVPDHGIKTKRAGRACAPPPPRTPLLLYLAPPTRALIFKALEHITAMQVLKLLWARGGQMHAGCDGV